MEILLERAATFFLATALWALLFSRFVRAQPKKKHGKRWWEALVITLSTVGFLYGTWRFSQEGGLYLYVALAGLYSLCIHTISNLTGRYK